MFFQRTSNDAIRGGTSGRLIFVLFREALKKYPKLNFFNFVGGKKCRKFNFLKTCLKSFSSHSKSFQTHFFLLTLRGGYPKLSRCSGAMYKGTKYLFSIRLPKHGLVSRKETSKASLGKMLYFLFPSFLRVETAFIAGSSISQTTSVTVSECKLPLTFFSALSLT